MLGPRGENPRASTAEVRGTRTIMRASTQESAFARERRGAPSALSNELFHDRNRGKVLPIHCLTGCPSTRVNTYIWWIGDLCKTARRARRVLRGCPGAP